MNEEAPDAVPFHFQAQHLAYLREVARAPTFTEAAARLHVSQPALSQALSELERRLGVPLFERRGRRRELTEAGREASRFASEVLGRAQELRAWMTAYREGGLGALSVGMIDAASLYALPEAVGAFRAAHPGVSLRLVVDTSDALVDLLRRFEVDLAFIVGPAPDDLEAVEVSREALHIYTPAGAPRDPAAADWVLYPARSHTRAQIDEGLGRLGIAPRVTLESSNPEVLRQMVALGFGWSVLPAAVAEADAAGLERREAVAERTLLGVRRRGGAADPRVEAFLRLSMASPASLRRERATAPLGAPPAV